MAPTSRKRRPRPSGSRAGGPRDQDGLAAGASSATATAPADAEAAQAGPSRRERGEARDELLRAQLEPLAPGERPVPLLVAVAVAAILAVGVLIGATTQHDLSSHGGSLIGGLFLAGAFAWLAGAMFNRRYFAVLGFEALIAFQIIVSCLALTVVSSLVVALVLLVVVGLGGWLFWKLVRVMGRIQVTNMRNLAGED